MGVGTRLDEWSFDNSPVGIHDLRFTGTVWVTFTPMNIGIRYRGSSGSLLFDRGMSGSTSGGSMNGAAPTM